MKKKKENNYCTLEASSLFSKKFKDYHSDAYNLNHQNLSLSSIGFGMYKGNYENKDRIQFQRIIKNLIMNGINVFDTARKYRNGFSEKDLGIQLIKLFKTKKLKRDEVYISSKAGLINFDLNQDRKFYLDKLVKKRGIKKSDIKNEIFCGSPKFLSQEIEISLKNINLNTLDNYYLHNPEFLLGNFNNYKDYYKIFEMFEKAIQDKKIRSYGISSWAGFRRNNESPFYIDIKKILKIAKDVGGRQNGFKNLQIPLSIFMPYTKINYYKNDKDDLFSFLNKKKINVFSSASLYEGKILEFFNLLKIFKYLNEKKIKKTITLDDLKNNKISLPISDYSIAQLFEVLQIISKRKSRIFPIYDKNIYKKSLNIVRSLNNITSSLFGLENLQQMNENIDILKSKKINLKDQKIFWNIFNFN